VLGIKFIPNLFKSVFCNIAQKRKSPFCISQF